MNFREVNKKLSELKQLRDVAHLTLNRNRTLASLTGYNQAVDNLEQFRNTKISNGGPMKKFIFTILNADYTLHKTIVFAESINEAHELWVEMFGDKLFCGNLNIEIM